MINIISDLRLAMSMKYSVFTSLLGLVLMTGCSEPEQAKTASASSPETPSTLSVQGRWITEADGQIMRNPQTSGLSVSQGRLVSISDASADSDQQRRLHIINSADATLLPKTEKMRIGSRVRRSCFSDYLADAPDLEALVADSEQPDYFYTVTEDATRTGALSPRCQKRYKDTGSTDYPTLLVRIERTSEGDLYMSRVRPLQFSRQMKVGDFPNDGIEGMALAPNGTLYLALEKDSEGQPRIFSVTMDDDFWDTTDFISVDEPAIQMPQWQQGNHPFNGLEYYHNPVDERGYLLAMARNDDVLWVLDPMGEKMPRKISMQFTAPTLSDQCDAHEVMDNASIEGITIMQDKLWLINDPWKVNYMKNLQCQSNQTRYEAMAPLLFSVPLKALGFDKPAAS